MSPDTPRPTAARPAGSSATTPPWPPVGCATPTSRRSPATRSQPVYGPGLNGIPEPASDDERARLERIGWPGEYPFTRGLYATGYRGRTWTIRQFAGFGNAVQTNERYKMILARGRRRALGRLRHAHPDGPRLRRRPQPRRGRPLRGRDRQRRRHGDPVRRHPARRRHHLDDDLRPGRAGVLHVPRRRRAAGRRPRRPQRHAADRHLQGVHRAEGVAVRAGAAPAPHRRPHGVLRGRTSPTTSRSRSPGYHIREAGSTAAQELAFTLADGFGYVELGLSRGMDVDVFAPGSVVLLRRARRLLRGDRQVPGGPADLGALAARRLRRARPTRRSGCGSTPRPPASR